MYIFMGITLISMCGLGYFTIWRLTDKTASTVDKSRHIIFQFVKYMNQIRHIITGLDKRLLNLETEIRLQKSDSSRLIEWLDKERVIREGERVEFLKSLKLHERESKIVELGERLKLITLKK